MLKNVDVCDQIQTIIENLFYINATIGVEGALSQMELAGLKNIIHAAITTLTRVNDHLNQLIENP